MAASLSHGRSPQAMDSLMPGFDKEIAKLAQRILINPRKIDYHTGVLATKVTPGAAPWAVKLLIRLALKTNAPHTPASFLRDGLNL